MFEAAPTGFHHVHCRVASRPAIQTSLFHGHSGDVSRVPSPSSLSSSPLILNFAKDPSRTHQMGLLEGRPASVRISCCHRRCQSYYDLSCQGQSANRSFGWFLLSSARSLSLMLCMLLVELLTPYRTIGAVRFQGSWSCSHTSSRLAREYNRCKCCHGLDVQATSNCNYFHSHVGCLHRFLRVAVFFIVFCVHRAP
jgi:hypothetical protein